MDYKELIKQAFDLRKDIDEIKQEALAPLEAELGKVQDQILRKMVEEGMKKVEIDGVGCASYVNRQTTKLNENKLQADLDTIGKNLEDYRYIGSTSEYVKLSDIKVD